MRVGNDIPTDDIEKEPIQVKRTPKAQTDAADKAEEGRPKEKGRGGRPKVENPRTEKITTYVTKENYEALVSIAKSREQSISSYISSLLSRAIREEFLS